MAVLGTLAAAIGASRAMTLSAGQSNIAQLLQQSNDIVVGTVDSVTDGIDDRGIAYTEITLNVSEAIRGELSGTYTFRQFGLLAPRLSADGTRKMMPAPDGFPKYTAGEGVVLFLRPSASWTGFRMPAGVTQGKFALAPGRLANESQNAGLFYNVRLQKGLATAAEKQMMSIGGAANPDTFLSFVRRAVRDRWIETGRMSLADGRSLPRNPPRPEANDPHARPSGPQSPAPPATQTLDPNANNALGVTPR
jgi:hypothetical protein